MNVIKAERAVIKIAGSEVEVFMLPDGSYRYSNASAARAINKVQSDVAKYLTNTNPEAADGAMLISVGRTRVKGLTSTAVTEYWHWKANNGNKEAKALVKALTAEALERRADSAFGNTKTEAQYEAQTTGLRLELLKAALKGYEPYRQGNRVQYLYNERDLSHLTTEEFDVACELAYIRTKQADLIRYPRNAESIKKRIANKTEELEAMGVRVSELV